MGSTTPLFSAVDTFLAEHPEPRANASSRFVAGVAARVLAAHFQLPSQDNALEDRFLTAVVLIHHERGVPRDTPINVEEMTAPLADLGQALTFESLRRRKAMVPQHEYPPECSIFSEAWGALSWERGPRFQEVLAKTEQGENR